MSDTADSSSGARAGEVRQLLAQGLDHYGQDEIGPAIKAWREVLKLHPGNEEAIDYLETADRRDQRSLPLSEQLTDTARNIVHEVRGMIAADDYEGAFDLLRSLPESEPTALEYEATVEIVRSRLLRVYSERVGNLDVVPMIVEASGDLTRFNLPPDAGFMLSLIDGGTRLADLISLCGMDAFEALRIVGSLLDAGIVEMRA